MVEELSSIPMTAVATIKALHKAENQSALIQIFSEFIEFLGLDTFQLTEVTDAYNFPGPNLSFGTLPAEYIKNYWKKGNSGLHDPVMRAIFASNRPLRFLHKEPPDTAQKPTKDILKRRAAAGIRDGYAFPLKGRLNRFAMVALHGDVEDLGAIDLASVEMVCISLYRRAADLHPLSSSLGFIKQGVLTVRERECLSWVAKGKTNWDISQILMITERTVQYHVENAREKLGAHTRLHAVVLAARQLELLL